MKRRKKRKIGLLYADPFTVSPLLYIEEYFIAMNL